MTKENLLEHNTGTTGAKEWIKKERKNTQRLVFYDTRDDYFNSYVRIYAPIFAKPKSWEILLALTI